MQDLAKKILLLARNIDINNKRAAELMTERGLETSRHRIDALTGSSKRAGTAPKPAELCFLIDAVVGEIKNRY